MTAKGKNPCNSGKASKAISVDIQIYNKIAFTQE